MKVMQVNSVYGRGSTGKVVRDLHESLLNLGVDSVVCFGRGSDPNEPGVRKTTTEAEAKLTALWARLGGLQYGAAPLGTRSLLDTIEAERPDVVHLHCINGYFVNIYRLLGHLKRREIPTVLTLHADFMFTGGCGTAGDCNRWMIGCGACPHLRDATKSYLLDRTHTAWLRMREACDGLDCLVVASVSPWLSARAQQSPILRNKQHVVVMNGLETDRVFRPRDTANLRAQLGIGSKRVVLHVTSNLRSDLKGSGHIRELARRMQNDGVAVVVVGGSAGGPTSDATGVLYVGRVDSQEELAEYYSLADVSVIVSSRETFSMTVAESLSCGTPVVGFMAGGPESIALSEGSTFVEYGHLDALVSAVRATIAAASDDHSVSLWQNASLLYGRDRMAREYAALYGGLL